MSEEKWDIKINSSSSLFDLRFREVWRYRDLLWLFVKRDIVTVYKQTILGPIWYLLQPILMTLIFVIVFGNIANISTDGLPHTLFYLSGVIIWNYFSESFSMTSKTFIENAQIFGKVYFPRIIIPLSKVISGLIKFLIQFILFVGVWVYFYLKGVDINITTPIFLFPVFVGLVACLGLGCGIFFSSLTTKYRDLNFLLQFGIQLLMYATPVIYPMSTLPEKYKNFILMNPLSYIIEGFRYSFLGQGEFRYEYLIYPTTFTCVLLLVSMVTFNKVERSFMDTV